MADLELRKEGHNDGHTHDFYEFFLILQGEFEERINGKSILLGKRQMHVLRPEDCHYLVCTNRYEKNILRNIAVEKEYFEKCLKEMGIEKSEVLFNSFELDEIAFANYKVKTNLLIESTYNEDTNHFLFQNIFSDLLICGLLQKKKSPDMPKWLEYAYVEIGKNKDYVEGLSKLIELSGKSQEHFTREFKKYYKITPSDYINHLRLQEAASLLHTCDEKIIDIMYQCGFNNLAYFNRLFKARYGIPPREYRATHKNIF